MAGSDHTSSRVVSWAALIVSALSLATSVVAIFGVHIGNREHDVATLTHQDAGPEVGQQDVGSEAARYAAEKVAYERDVALVRVDAEFDTKNCPEEHTHLRVTVSNGSNRTLRSLALRIEIYEPGRSSNLAGSFAGYDWDIILLPGKREERCYVFGFERTYSKQYMDSLIVRTDARKVEFYSSDEAPPLSK